MALKDMMNAYQKIEFARLMSIAYLKSDIIKLLNINRNRLNKQLMRPADIGIFKKEKINSNSDDKLYEAYEILIEVVEQKLEADRLLFEACKFNEMSDYKKYQDTMLQAIRKKRAYEEDKIKAYDYFINGF